MNNIKFFLPLLLFPIFLFFIYIQIGIPNNILFSFTNFFILALSYFGMFYYFPKRTYSLCKTVFLFCFIFYGIIPLRNEVNGNIIYGNSFDILDKIKTNLIICFSLIIFFFGGLIKLNVFEKIEKFSPQLKKINLFYFFLFFS